VRRRRRVRRLKRRDDSPPSGEASTNRVTTFKRPDRTGDGWCKIGKSISGRGRTRFPHAGPQRNSMSFRVLLDLGLDRKILCFGP